MNIVIYGMASPLQDNRTIGSKIARIMLGIFPMEILKETAITIITSKCSKITPFGEDLPFVEIRHDTNEQKKAVELGVALSKLGFDVEIPLPRKFIPRE